MFDQKTEPKNSFDHVNLLTEKDLRIKELEQTLEIIRSDNRKKTQEILVLKEKNDSLMKEKSSREDIDILFDRIDLLEGILNENINFEQLEEKDFIILKISKSATPKQIENYRKTLSSLFKSGKPIIILKSNEDISSMNERDLESIGLKRI